MMQATAYGHINAFLERLLGEMKGVLGEKLVGLYLFGSLVMGDYDDSVSDIDLLAALTDDIDEATFAALKAMQDGLILEYPQWQDRLEIAYLSVHALRTFKTESSPIGIISPGEPFHIIEAGKDWLMNWYIVQEKGVALFGPPPATLIEPISQDEYVEAVKRHMAAWRQWSGPEWMHSRPSQAYAILTVCRALYTVRYGEQPSKIRAAEWAAKELPEWAELIRQAVEWRQAWRETDVDAAATLEETRRFVRVGIERINPHPPAPSPLRKEGE
jgi:predicted nucleotidyltransferase